jgi:hypothetical protein
MRQTEIDDAPNVEMRGTIQQPTLLLMHVLAGKSILTCRSRKTGERYTFRFSRPDAEPGKKRPIWVSIYGGPQGSYTATGGERRNWSFLGTIWPGTNEDPTFRYRHSPKSKLPSDDKAARGAVWVAQHLHLMADKLLEQAEWWHEGVCGRCGRRLTVPESIATGFGPECAGKVGLSRVERMSHESVASAQAGLVPARLPKGVDLSKLRMKAPCGCDPEGENCLMHGGPQ